jgi:hypothetical protein
MRLRVAVLLVVLHVAGSATAAPESAGQGLPLWRRLIPKALRITPRTSSRKPVVEPARLPITTPAPATSKLPRALLPNGSAVAPTSFSGGYHGTSAVPPEVALRDGLPARGDDWRLLEHAEQHSRSAFRGATPVISEPVSGNGAAYWAGAGGWVYDIPNVPSWDVNVLLEGRVSVAGLRFRGNLMSGEMEIAIPARILPEQIRAFGVVEESAAGRLFVRRWIANPGYRGPAPRRRRRRLAPRPRPAPRAPAAVPAAA